MEYSFHCYHVKAHIFGYQPCYKEEITLLPPWLEDRRRVEDAP